MFMFCVMDVHSLKGSYQRHRKPIWFYAREIDYEDDFLDKATYGEI
jgi:hypothetical protein